MTRDGLARLDLDTRHLYHRRLRQLQITERQKWPNYYTAWMALLCESWASQERLTLDETWLPALPCRLDSARSALQRVGLIDQESRIPAGSWEDWVRPAIDRLHRLSAAGIKANRVRWGNEHGSADNADPVGIAAGSPSRSPASQPANIANQGKESDHNRTTFRGFHNRAMSDNIKRQQDEDWLPCNECGVLGRKHPTGGAHLFQPAKEASP